MLNYLLKLMQLFMSRLLNTFYYLFFLLCISVFIFSCDDETGTLGVNMIPSSDLVNKSFNIYDVKSSSYEVGDKVLARSSKSYLGKFTDPETGTSITSDFLAQFYCPESFDFPSTIVDDYITSVELKLYVSSFIGDSLASFKLNVYELDKILDAEQDYYTNINPKDYYDTESSLIATKWYTLSDRTISEEERFADNYYNCIKISLPREIGQAIYDEYVIHPETFANTNTWINSGLKGSKGFYFEIESGDGAIAYIDVAHLNINFKYLDSEIETDGVVQFASTEEVVQATRFQNSDLSKLLDDNNATYIKSPAGIFTLAEIPVNEISDVDTINSAKLTFTRYNDLIDSKFKLSLPKYVLLVRLDDYVNGYFEKYSLADNVTSYITQFASSSNKYQFDNIAKLINTMKTELKNGTATDNYNKVLLIPVDVTFDSESKLVKLVHDFSMTSAKLVGGDSNPVKLEVIYSRFK